MIDKLTVDKIYDAAQIVDVVSDFVTLKKRGVNYVGLCPFHEDSSPSFYISPAKNICKCFACGEGGTSVQFIMKHEQVSYYEALRFLAKKYGIEIKERELSEEEKQMRSDRESMLVVNSWAQKFFTSRLYESEEGKSIGLRYFVERGFREDIIRKFQLGYALNKRDDLYGSALKHGFNEDYLFKTGLAYKRDNGSVCDRFFGRAIFPIHTLSGKVVAFGGRVMSNKEKVAKYVNSPDSEIYHKSHELYGIYFSKQAIVKADKCFLVEGYTDVISMHQTGIENVVASSGTALTHGQIRLIHRFTTNITVLYDGDAAGIKAAIRGVDMLLEEGMNVKVVLLPEGEDPDSFARSHNSFDFALYIEQHEMDFIRFKIELLRKEAGNDPMKKVQLIKEVMASVAVIPDPTARSVYIKECVHLLDESEQVLLNEVIKLRSQRKTTPPTTPTSVRSGGSAQGKSRTSESDAGQAEGADATAETGQAVDATSASGFATGDGSVHMPVAEGGFGVHAGDGMEADTPGGTTTGAVPESMIEKTRSVYYPFRKYERALIRYVVRYGERVLFVIEDAETEGNPTVFIRVAEYIRQELAEKEEGIDMSLQVPLFQQILNEAVEQCKQEGFVASDYFLTHAELKISELAVDMMSTRYQLSKFFSASDDVALKQTSSTKEEQEANEAVWRMNKEREELERWVVHDLFVLKTAHVKQEIAALNKQLKTLLQSDEEEALALLKRRMALDKIKGRLSKELGDRPVTGFGK